MKNTLPCKSTQSKPAVIAKLVFTKLAALKLTARAAALVTALVTGLTAVTQAAAIQSRYNIPLPVTQIARDIHWLHWMMLLICTVIFLGVFGVMFYSIWKHRKSRGATPAEFHESTQVEVLWTIIPFFIVVGMALPATKTVVAMKDTTNADVTIKATGYQWKWGYDYLNGEGEGIGYLSTLSTPRDQIDGGNDAARTANSTYLIEVDNDLVVPVDKKIRVITTANDVIHAWMVPALGVKQDAIPGLVRDTWFRAEQTGVYRGQCAELCGRDHAFMPIVVRVVSQDDYSKWVAARKKEMAIRADDPNKVWELQALLERGSRVYATACQACHQANGQGVKGTFPSLDGSKIVKDKDQQIQIILDGKSAMPSWKTLTDVELAAVATFVRNAWSNRLGDTVQPSEFKAARK